MSNPIQKMLADRQALIDNIVSNMEVLRNVYGITPEFIWNNISPTHRICVNDDSVKRCEEWEHFEPQDHISVSVNEGKPNTFIDEVYDGCCNSCCEEAEKRCEEAEKQMEKTKDIQFNHAYE